MSKFILVSVTFLVLIVSALSQDVVSHFDDTADFSKFKTYKWITLKSVAPIDELTDEQVRAALDAGLARKGLSKVDGDSSADLFIGYQTTEQVQEQVPGSDIRTGSLDLKTTAWTIYKGQLAVSMFDAANRKLIWRGVATKTFNRRDDATERQKHLNKAVQKLFKHYPHSGDDVPFGPRL